MAILLSRPSVKITIMCNGAPLQEHNDDDEESHPNVVSKYVEAISGAEFGVQWEISSPWPPYTILFEYWLDQKKALYKHPAYTYLKEGASTTVNGREYLHRFAFAALTVDDAGGSNVQDQLMKDIKGMGEITVKAWFVKNLQTSIPADRALYSNIKEVGKIPEKALKGRTLSHQASLRAPQETATVTATATCEYIDPAQEPFATYAFRYRSRDALKSLMVIPRSPSPVPLEERDVDTLKVEEMRELLRRQRERDAAARAVKQERGVKREYARERSSTFTDDAGDDVVVVSSKRRREHYRTMVDEHGIEAIDLT